MAKQSILESFPAMDVVTREPGFDGFVEITSNDTVALQRETVRYGAMWYGFNPGSVVSYALESGKCPIDSVERARKNAHVLHWFNPRAVVLTAEKRERETWVGLEYGQRVKFEGRVFRVDRARGNSEHVNLVDVTNEKAEGVTA